ncbi:MAG: hypothetical protein EA401_14800 [Planctomycetota bacterium]|nr:MAG: hypothetical protein EA401_14800 [Planctomycetota bacterium]
MQGDSKLVRKWNARFAGHALNAKNTPFGGFLLADREIGVPRDKLGAALPKGDGRLAAAQPQQIVNGIYGLLRWP